MSREVKFVLGLPPEQAVEFLRQKKLLSSKALKGNLESALAKATTIANVTSLEMTKDIYQSIEDAMREGKSFHKWKKELVAHLERKGWVVAQDKKLGKGIDGKLIADPKTGELFGTPRRLGTIFRTNMQAAYSAARYQRMMDNIDNRPYWQYSAVGDERTRPAHQAFSGLIYRYDDPFWATFYPPNGFNCRCTVIALGERDLKRRNLVVGDSSERLVEEFRPANRRGETEKSIGFKLSNGTIRFADKGFDYNLGRLSYRPNLDSYPEPLAHQFAKQEMQGGEFKWAYQQLEQQLQTLKQAQQISGKLNQEQMTEFRNQLSRNFKFAAGRLSQENQRLIKSNIGTVWLSDDTLIKQLNSREGQGFEVDEYVNLPDIINQPDKLLFGKKENHLEFYKMIGGKRYLIVVKNLKDELFLQSFRLQNEKEWRKAFENSR